MEYLYVKFNDLIAARPRPKNTKTKAKKFCQILLLAVDNILPFLMHLRVD